MAVWAGSAGWQCGLAVWAGTVWAPALSGGCACTCMHMVYITHMHTHEVCILCAHTRRGAKADLCVRLAVCMLGGFNHRHEMLGTPWARHRLLDTGLTPEQTLSDETAPILHAARYAGVGYSGRVARDVHAACILGPTTEDFVGVGERKPCPFLRACSVWARVPLIYRVLQQEVWNVGVKVRRICIQGSGCGMWVSRLGVYVCRGAGVECGCQGRRICMQGSGCGMWVSR